jgi:hypothetical protein
MTFCPVIPMFEACDGQSKLAKFKRFGNFEDMVATDTHTLGGGRRERA